MTASVQTEQVIGVAACITGTRRNRWLAWAKFRRNRLAFVSAAVVIVLILLAVSAPWIAPRDPL
jgi:ABC-type antimicrobial peptide transport system permease subunit